MHLNDVISLIRAELDRAVTKFPTWPTDIIHAAAVVSEESGELSKAVLQCVYEPHKSDLKDVRDEAVQTAAMAIRFLLSINSYDLVTSEQHSQHVPPGASPPDAEVIIRRLLTLTGSLGHDGNSQTCRDARTFLDGWA